MANTGGTVVELRVHGVSGTPPEALLGCPTEFIEQVAGDKSAGFWRRRKWIDDASNADADGDLATDASRWRRVMEAYSWGGLTSRRANRAVWLLFLPFIFINLAHWMLPPGAKERRSAGSIAVALLRLLALSFTLTLMLAGALAVMDVMVWQCMSLDHCGSQLGPLSRLMSIPRGQQVAISAVPLVVVIAVLWFLGRETTWDDKGDDEDTQLPPPPHPAVMENEVPLEEKTFWHADDSVVRMRACHVMAWNAGLGALSLAVPLHYAESSVVRAWSVALLVANGLILTVAVVATGWNKATARGGDSADSLTTPLLIMRRISLGLLVASLIWVGATPAKYPGSLTPFPSLAMAIYVLLGVQVLLLLAVFLFTAVSLRQRGDDQRTAGEGGAWGATLGGFTAPFVALIAWLLGCGFSVGVGLGVAERLGEVVVTTSVAHAEIGQRKFTLKSSLASFEEKVAALNTEARLVVPPPYLWGAMAVVLAIAVTILVGLCVWRWTVTRRTKYELDFGDKNQPQPGSVLSDYVGCLGADADNERVLQLARSRAWAYLTDLGPRVVASLAVFTVVATALLSVAYLTDFAKFGTFTRYQTVLANGSVFVAVALPTGLLLLTVQAYRNRQLRRVVGVLWDIVTFWPRANHPLTPPCYAERTVPELLERIGVLVKQGDIVIVAAHSQGTIIAAATLLRADRDDRCVGLLTFGSPLRRLYARNFPAYFGTGALPELCRRQRPRWINLWACSDPIGSWVNDKNDRKLAEAPQDVDFRLRDVEGLEKKPDRTYPPICGHSGFWNRREYYEAVNVLDSKLTPTEVTTDTRAIAPPTAQYM